MLTYDKIPAKCKDIPEFLTLNKIALRKWCVSWNFVTRSEKIMQF